MPQLDNYLVSLGLKGQKAVLSTIDNIRKKGAGLSKKPVVLTAKIKPPKTSELPQGEPLAPGTPGAPVPPSSPNIPPANPDSRRFLRATERFTDGVKNFAGAAATLDPTAVISSVTSAIGTSLSGISVLGVSLGRLPEGIAAIANSTLSMARNSVEMARQAAAAFYQLTTRNAAAQYYGERVTQTGPLSRNERAIFIDAVSGSMGRIQRPLADAINNLIGTKDTRALARAAAGDWESTGTDRGWMLGQISGSFQGLPPSMRQQLQAALLRNYADEIQNNAPGQAGAQRSAAAWANMEENQTARLAEQAPRALGLAQNLNDMQVSLYNAGIGFASSINSAINNINRLATEIPRLTSALRNLTNKPSMQSLRTLISTMGGSRR